MKKKLPTVETDDTYKKRYKMRSQGQGGLNTVVSLPREVIEREANKRGVSIDIFIARYRAVAHYNNFDGIFYAFEEADVKEMPRMQEAKNP